MDYEFDPDKDKQNQQKHGVSLLLAEGFEWDTATTRADTRFDYDEERYEATGYVGDRLYVMIFCWRKEALRVISFRPATPKEVRRYAQA
ncbi:hypothetical protein AGMMS50289_09730 [Betaproteobacteria bacterium]|nr:hypothetical protein AGMMS50289_09730 [Betaproteobacteria bacterium]